MCVCVCSCESVGYMCMQQWRTQGCVCLIMCLENSQISPFSVVACGADKELGWLHWVNVALLLLLFKSWSCLLKIWSL